MDEARKALVRVALNQGWATMEDAARIVDVPLGTRTGDVVRPLVRRGVIVPNGYVTSARRARPARRVARYAVADRSKATAWLAAAK